MYVYKSYSTLVCLSVVTMRFIGCDANSKITAVMLIQYGCIMIGTSISIYLRMLGVACCVVDIESGSSQYYGWENTCWS